AAADLEPRSWPAASGARAYRGIRQGGGKAGPFGPPGTGVLGFRTGNRGHQIDRHGEASGPGRVRLKPRSCCGFAPSRPQSSLIGAEPITLAVSQSFTTSTFPT